MYKKVLIVICLSISLIGLVYLCWSYIIYSRSTFYIYPDISDNYDIVGEIDTPEEALEFCRSKIIFFDKDGNSSNYMKINLWDSKIMYIDKFPVFDDGKNKYFQLRVLKKLNDTWSVVSSIESEDSKECFSCFNLSFKPSRTRSCTIDRYGKLIE